MLLHKGRTYSPDYLDMESKVDLILKELQYLKLRIEELKKQKRELKRRHSR